MAMFMQVEKIQKILIFLLFFKCRIFLVQSQATTITREIQNDKERIVQAGSNFTLSCTATRSDPKMDVSFEWQYPHKNEDVWAGIYHEDSEFEIKMKFQGFKGAMMITPVHNRSVVFERQLENGNFLSTLQITNASFFDTGFYTCIIRNGTEGNIIQTSEQHVFVHDSEFKFVPPITDLWGFADVVLGIVSQPNFTVECRPTHPSVHMELFFISNPSLKNRELIASSNNSLIGKGFWSFNPFKGFILQKPVTFNISGKYECRADSIYKAKIKVEIYGLEIITSTNSEQIPAETSFEITCRSRKPGKYPMHLSWLWIPDEPFNGQKEVLLNETMLPPGLLKIENIETRMESNLVYYDDSFLKWQNIPVEASGIYQCSEWFYKYPPATIRLNVSFHLPQRFSEVHMDEDGNFFLDFYLSKELEKRYNLEEKIYNAGDRIQMECQANVPNLFLKWKTIPGRDSWLDRFSDFTNSSGQSSSVTRTVVNASFLDTGYYFCLGPLNYRDKSYSLYGSKFIFVLDPQHLVLPPRLSNRTSGLVKVKRYYGVKNIPIGCGPTHPDVQVFLNHRNIPNETFKEIASSLSPNDKNSEWTFSTHAGFILKTTNSWEIEGEFFCSAKWPNETIATNVTQNFAFFVEGIEILPLNSTTIFEGDELVLMCKSDLDYYYDDYYYDDDEIVDLSWKRLSHLETERLGYRGDRDVLSEGFRLIMIIESEKTVEDGFRINRLRFKEIEVEDAGLYQCCKYIDIEKFSRNCQYISVYVSRLEIPIVDSLKQEIDTSQNEQVILTCILRNNVPKVEVEWFVVKTDGNSYLIGSSSPDYTINPMKDGRSELVVHQAVVSDAKFKCVFRNWKGNATKEFAVNVKPKIWTNGKIAAIVIAIIVIITIAIIIVRWKFIKSIRKQKRMYQELVNTRLKLLEGNLERINPDKPIEDQIELLPYDPKYEFPINRLIQGKQLGVGQFGRVVKATAIGLDPSGTNKTVAVKTVKNETDYTALSSLASELKILIHLGSHLNIVSLLGACTKKLNKGELLVIVEFCRYGNLKDFLVENRNRFIIESNLKTDCQIKGDEEAQSAEASSNDTDVEKLQENEGYLIPCNKNDKNIRKSSICVHDLMNWSFQIACGMNYVTNKKVLHGDLAARNVLLADDNIVKIADFGLSRKLYRSYDYLKQGEEALPVKWMAIESLVDRVFSTKSDVWAFGVTIWEIFTLGQQPYTKVLGYAGLIEFLQSGHRMEKPKYAPQIIGQIMSDCWKPNPDERITFAQLEQTLKQFVDEKTLERIARNQCPYLELESEPTNVSQDYVNISSQATGEYESLHQGRVYENLIQDFDHPLKEGIMDRELD